MPRGSHRGGLRRRWPFVGGAIVAVVAAAATAWFLVGGGNPLAQVADFSFELGRVGGSAVDERAPEAELQDAAEQIRETLDEMYLVGFVDHTKWDGGKFPDLYEAFADDIQGKVRHDLPNLSLGADAAKIDSVDPVQGRLSVRFLVNEESEPVAATAYAVFAANAVPKDGAGNVVINHNGTYYLRPGGDGWLISGYDVEGVVTRGQRLPGRAGA